MSEFDVDRLRGWLPGHITISSQLPNGKGGQGTVFRGVCNGHDSAIKVFRADADPRRVAREIELLSNLSCAHLVRLLHHLNAQIDGEDVRVIVYEFHPGGDLNQFLGPGTARLTTAEILRIGHEMATAIDVLWSQRIVHRDIKPANIVRAADGRHVLVDVGFARHVDRSDITHPGGAPGTNGFRSPEQARGRRSLTLKSDIFSLGVSLFMLATQSHPFGGRDCITSTHPNIQPLRLRTDLPPEAAELIGQMLSFAPAERPQYLSERFATLRGIPCSS